MVIDAVPTVLVLSGDDDSTADAVVTELSARPVRVVRLDTGDFPTRLRLSASITDEWRGRLWMEDIAVELDEVTSVYYRRPTRFRFPEGLSTGDEVFASAEARRGFGGVLATLDALWVNDPARVAVADYKPVQQKIARRVGLSVPRTLVTNDHASAVQFAKTVGGRIVCKMFSSVVLNDNGETRFTYTTPVEVNDIDPAELATTAHMLQEWVPKQFETRVTMVGHRPFGVAIHATSEAAHVDWRADYEALTYKPIDPPTEVTAGMTRYLDRLGLAFGAFDFVITPEDRWIMLECNPMGQWLWLEEATSMPIAAGIADLLTNGTLT